MARYVKLQDAVNPTPGSGVPGYSPPVNCYDTVTGTWVSGSFCGGYMGGAISRFLNRGRGIVNYRGFITSPDASTKSNVIFTGAAILGAVAARKLIKKGDKNLNTALGGVGGLLLGVAISKLIK